MNWERTHAEADQALNDSSYKMVGLARLIPYNGFLLAEGKAFNLSNISVIKVNEICESMKYGKYISGLINIQIGFDIVFEFERNNIYTYKSFRLSEAVIQEITTYLNGINTVYPIDTKSIILNPLKQLKEIVSYEMEILFNTIRK